MGDQKKSDVAAALAALAGGAVPSEGETPSGGIPSESTVFSAPPIEPPPVQPADTADAAPPISRSRAASAPPPALRPSMKPGDERPPRATGPSSSPPSSLPLPSAVPPPARIRPAMPERPVAAPVPPPTPVVDEVPDTIPEMVEDEETIAAAPDASAFARREIRKPAHTPVYASLFFRRTMIPIMLTCGVMLPAIGLWSMIDHNAPLAAVGTGVEVMLIVIGTVLLALGILNAFHVKHVLGMSAKRQTN